MAFHTPPPTVDVEQIVPGLGAYRMTATRLHPRRGDVTADMSHIGGPLLWPADEPSPTCTAVYEAEHTVPMPAAAVARLRSIGPDATPLEQAAALREASSLLGVASRGINMDPASATAKVTSDEPHDPPNPLLALAQLKAADIPDLWCPAGTDMLQVLWCPCGHDANLMFGPMIELRWRRAADCSTVATPPPPLIGDDDYRPRPCRLHPEQTVEYPTTDRLPTALADIIGQRLSDIDSGSTYERDYQYSLSIAPGWKVGGYPEWNVSDADPMLCTVCGEPTSLLLTIASTEYNDGSQARWQVTEDRHIGWRDPGRDAVEKPTGVVVGRAASLRIFVCTQCPGTPHRLSYQ